MRAAVAGTRRNAGGREFLAKSEKDAKEIFFEGSFFGEGCSERSSRRFVDAAFVPVGVNARKEAKPAKVFAEEFSGLKQAG